jgi:hypothetical protein
MTGGSWLEFTQANVFLAIFLVGAGFSVVSFVLGELFHGMESLLEGLFNIGDFLDLGEGGEGTNPGLFRSLVVFVTGFGAGGWAATTQGMGGLASTLVGGVSGLICGGVTLALLVFVAKQQGSSVMAPSAMVGKAGSLIIGIPPGGAGQAVLSVAGARITTSARSATGEALAPNTRVRVVAVEGGVAVVEAIR